MFGQMAIGLWIKVASSCRALDQSGKQWDACMENTT